MVSYVMYGLPNKTEEKGKEIEKNKIRKKSDRILRRLQPPEEYIPLSFR